MTPGKLALYFFVQWLILALLKVWLLSGQPVLSNSGLQMLLFWFLACIVAVAVVRRFGILNFLEVFFLAIVWTIGYSVLDLIFTTPFTGLKLFFRIDYWAAYVLIAAAIVLFHKKRHVAIRKGLHVPSAHH